MAITREDLMRAGIGTGGMNPNVIQVQEMPIGRLPAAAPAPTPMPVAPMPAQAAPQRQGLLGGFLGPQGRDARARLAIALEGMTLNPNQALIGQLQQDIESRETARQNNATVAWLRSRGRNDLADAVEMGGLSASDAMKAALEPAPTVDPQSAIAKLAEDLRNGLITQEQFDIAAAGLAPQGMSIETGPDGQLRIVQGAGAGARAGKPFTEGEGKDVVYATRARGALEVLEPVAGELTSLGSQIAGYDPTGIVRSRVQSSNYQVARQAGDEFLQAILRKDTGAAITAGEQALYGVTYLPQPGDGPEVLEAKRAARQRAVAAINAGMSPAQMIAAETALGTQTATAQGGPVRISNDAEYDALPSGTQFIGPDNKLRRKP
jgi:hypothetical protein